MFRSVCKQFGMKSPFTYMPKCSFAEQQTFKRPSEINSVTLMGTIVQDMWQQKNGVFKFYMKTVNVDKSFFVHRVAIANQLLLNMTKNKLSLGQRVYIGGKVKSIDFWNHDQRRRQEVEILANELYFMDAHVPDIDDDLIHSTDENSIEMLTFVSSPVKNMANFSTFVVATHYTQKKNSYGETEATDFHKIIIQKGPLLDRCRQLRKFDRIYLNGFINYNTEQDSEGRQRASGFIEPTSLIRLMKSQKTQERLARVTT